MSTQPPFRKVFEGVATRSQMFALFNRHRDTPGVDPLSGVPYASEWFEISATEYHFMLGLLPPLFQRTGMFGMSEYKAGNVTSVFFAIRIRGRERWFHGFCDLSDKRSPDAMRAAIIAHETGALDSMTREEKIEAIWSATHADFRGIAGETDPDAWPPEHHGKRTILVYTVGQGTTLKLLEDLPDEEIDSRMPAVDARSRRKGGHDTEPS
ncbi:DUF1419 domain-containing protein [Mesorhizobium sp. M1A.F.Ca.IN.020.06.1.1]|uniref:DUF1419 domain-containing protein n=1 Tax=unclassified Mesorhizobium TaxID=325217 RepID=UPI000FCA01B2|nr:MULTISPECIES: DUF1419 domain-containing protein [unclassified Mesorhizobium]RUV81565.1 DUF1419 domain-containing protein [Mesorhizobium sp. M1A.F.Ca.IN.020.32.1.1]RUW03951.1 DUF1419 domain-containing protein [Mesorhizobium sp. M1A.F.Ca.IN.022.05.2.1]RUW31015.1 DUF1419 domain-containing protein [Mesorhizobium sp. M1A.F.Ca.IN.020.06.1.1]RWF82907.1 MAG: DUF1419 domain-containing protein [Mesorhizobium sp.]RWG05695.1 MAG: DUF1419 domain-containing protein [Mesorhizobium sp.]